MRFRGFAVALLAAVSLVACGGHHSPTTPTPTPSDGGNGGTPPPPPPPPPAAPPPTLSVTRVLAFGDSMTEGVTQPPLALNGVVLFSNPPAPTGAGIAVSYPAKLQGLDTTRYSAQTTAVLNGGAAGNKAADDRDAHRLSDYLSATHPDVVLLMEGANDLNDIGAKPTSQQITALVSKTVDAMEDMVRDALGRNVPVLLATLPPQRAGGQRAGAAAFLSQYNDALKAMAAKKGATLVDVNAQFPLDQIGQDGLHPTEAGYDTIAKIFQDAMAAKWEQAPAPTLK